MKQFPYPRDSRGDRTANDETDNPTLLVVPLGVAVPHRANFCLSPERPPRMSLIVAPVPSRLLSVQVSLLFPLVSGEFALLLSISGVAVVV